VYAAKWRQHAVGHDGRAPRVDDVPFERVLLGMHRHRSQK
jgi:hypothetical protein